MFKKLLSLFVLLMTVGSMWGKTYNFNAYAQALGTNTDLSVENNRFQDINSEAFSFDGIFGTNQGTTWWFRQSGGYVGLCNKNNGIRNLTIYDLKKGQSLTFSKKDDTSLTITSNNVLNAIANTTTITDGVVYVISQDGNLTLNVNSYGCIYSVTIEDAPEIYFDAGTYTANIQDYNQFEEPTLHYPDGATVLSYASSNEKIAKLLWDNNVAFRGSGIVTITATVVYNGVTYTPSYNVTVKAEQAEPVVAGNTCTLSGVGRLNPQSAAVPGLYMEFGNISLNDPNKNTTIVQQLHGYLYATTIDQNGYRPVWWENGLPHQGTFYTFKPTVSGTLKVWVNGDYNEDAAYMIESTSPSTKIGETTLDVNVNNNSPKELTFTLDAGKTYYLCNTAQYNPLYLNKVTYEPSFKFSANSATVENGTASYNGISLTGYSGQATFTIETYGNISAATVDNSGHITSITYSDDDKGGAVVVHASCEAGTATYVLTVAYNQHLWDFTRTISSDAPHGTPLTPNDILNELTDNKVNFDKWAVTYKVREYDNVDGKNYFRRVNVPVICNAEPFDGTNADYNEYTAGLTITAGAKAFGSNATIPGDYYSADGYIYNLDALGLPASEVNNAQILTLYYGSTLTIPYLEHGQYVRVKWQRYSEGKGDKVTLSNLADLKGTPMDAADYSTDFAYTNNIRVGLHGEGYHVFKVKNSGPVSFTVADDGWLNIYSIQVSDDLLDDNCWIDMISTHTGAMDTQLTFPETTVYNSLKNSEIGNTTYTWRAQGGSIRGQQNISVTYSLEGLDGGDISSTLSGTEIINEVSKSGNGQVQFTSKFVPIGHGQLVAVSDGFTYQVTDAQFDISDIEHVKIYHLDLQRTLITVNETGSTAQVYPYTWDFTNISNDTKERLVEDNVYWSGNATNGFTPTATYQKDFTENTEITTSKTDLKWKRSEIVSAGNDYYGFAEYDGIGFNTNPENGYSTSLTSIKVTTDGTGLVVGDGSANAKDVTLNLPQVDAGYTVYVRVKENSNASVTVGGKTNVGYTDSEAGEKVYTYTTTEKADVPVVVKNAEVKKIAVTNMNKTCWLKDTNSKDGDTYDYYNTDSRDNAIDYSLTEYFTGKEIKAYTVTATNEDSETNLVNSVIISPIVLAPKGHGYIVSTKYDSDPNQANSSQASLYKRPLFMPCVIDIQGRGKNQMGTPNDNFLKPHISAGSIADDIDPSNSKVSGLNEDDYDFYVLTNKYYSIYDNSHQITTAEVPGFYRLENINDGLAKNRAFLALEKPQNSGNGVKFIPLFDFDGELVDAIDMIPTESSDSGIDVNGTFYTLQGMKIQGFPQKSGIYIQNGKKILVK